MTSVLLVTCAKLAEGEPGGELLLPAFAAAGADAHWVVWDDPDVDWASADVVAVRSTWDYDARLSEFLAWARSLGPTLLNGAAAFEWNTDLLTELSARPRGRFVRRGVVLVRFRSRDQRRGCAAGVVRAGGAAAGVA